MRRIRQHLTYANVISTLCLFLLLGGGTAVALDGSNTVFSDDIVNNQVKSADVRDDTLSSGGLQAFDLAPKSVGSSEVINEGLTGADIKNQSGVDTCTHGTVRYGELCVGIANEHHNWMGSLNLCASLGLRLPTVGEAWSLAAGNDLPTVDQSEFFWTDEISQGYAFAVSDSNSFGSADRNTGSAETVCVTTPTN
jgi:hypothetical protein